MLDLILVFCFLNNANSQSYPFAPPPYPPYMYAPPAQPLQHTRQKFGNSGAIAYSTKNSAYGFSFNQPGKQRAEQMAMRGCQQHAADCKIEGRFENACGALAVSASSETFFCPGSIRSCCQPTRLQPMR